ncbi:MAG: septum formation initiator family protein [Bacteroidales bacterium]|jgi:cell division protein FtsB|nr:septum formation initiator family protein [Bacteroidales bacterium]MBR2227652.1 septum formation initiator family protein [Bacteroidales bacterium]
MARKKEKGSLLTRSDHNYFLPFVIVVTAVAALWLLFLSHSSVLNWVRANIEIRRQERQMDKYRQEIDEMDAEIRALTDSKDSLEKFARETYHFAAPGEDVYIIE